MSSQRPSGPSIILFTLLACGPVACFVETTIPACLTLADCPAGQGFVGCVDGWCYQQGACDDRPVIAGDGCCALTEGDRSDDLDCMLRDMPLSCLDAAGPTLDDDGNLFVTCLMSGDDGLKNVIMRRLDGSGILSVPIVAGPGNVAYPPVKGVGNTLLVQTSEGFVRYGTRTLGVAGSQAAPTPSAAMASNNGSAASRTVAGWPSPDGRVHLFDEDRNVIFSFGQTRPELGASGAMGPSISWTGRRMYVTWNAGVLDVLEVGSNPLGQVMSIQLPALPAGPAIDVDGMVYVPLVDGRLVRYRETAQVSLEAVWTLELFGGAPQARVFLLVRDDNAIVAISLSGQVQVVRDMDTFGSIVATGEFSRALAEIHPVLAESGRVVAVAESGRIVSVQKEDASGRILPGVEFAVPSRPDSDLILDGNSLVYVSETGSLMSWSFPDASATGRWTRSGANAGSTGRISVPPAVEVNN